MLGIHDYNNKELRNYSVLFMTDRQADWVVEKLKSFGIEAERGGCMEVWYRTTWKRNATLRFLFKWWNGENEEWWSYFDNSWHWKPNACVEAMHYGSEVPNPFAFNEETKQKYRERHMRRHGNHV